MPGRPSPSLWTPATDTVADTFTEPGPLTAGTDWHAIPLLAPNGTADVLTYTGGTTDADFHLRVGPDRRRRADH